MLKFKTRCYTEGGGVRSELYTNDLREAIELYISWRDRTKNSACRPTLWALHNGNYVRVHDFNFEVLSDETYQKYLEERILWSDYLLEELAK